MRPLILLLLLGPCLGAPRAAAVAWRARLPSVGAYLTDIAPPEHRRELWAWVRSVPAEINRLLTAKWTAAACVAVGSALDKKGPVLPGPATGHTRPRIDGAL